MRKNKRVLRGIGQGAKFIVVLIGFLFVVGSLFGVIFSQLGFSNSADYTSEMFQIETENLTAAMDTYFSDAGHVASISALLADFDGSRYGTYDTSHMLPSAGTLKSLYDAVDADYNGVYEAHTQVTGEGRKADGGCRRDKSRIRRLYAGV